VLARLACIDGHEDDREKSGTAAYDPARVTDNRRATKKAINPSGCGRGVDVAETEKEEVYGYRYLAGTRL